MSRERLTKTSVSNGASSHRPPSKSCCDHLQSGRRFDSHKLSSGGLQGPANTRTPQLAFEGGAIPIGRARGRLVSTLQEGEQRSLRVSGGTDPVVGKQKLTELVAKKCAFGPHGALAKALGCWVCI